MRVRIILTIFLISLGLISPAVNAQKNVIPSCELINTTGLCISVTLNTTIDGWHYTISEYEFPDRVRVNDHLSIDKLEIINKGKDVSPEINYRLQVLPLAQRFPELHDKDYGTYHTYIPELDPNDKYVISFSGNFYHTATLNNQLVSNAISLRFPRLYEEGEWLIKDNSMEIEYPILLIINGIPSYDLEYFKVYSRPELANMEIAEETRTMIKENRESNKRTIYIMGLVGIITVAVMALIGIFTIKNQSHIAEKTSEKMDKQTLAIEKMVSHITETSKIEEQKKP